MLNMFKSGVTKLGLNLAVHTILTLQRNKIKTCLIKMC